MKKAEKTAKETSRSLVVNGSTVAELEEFDDDLTELQRSYAAFTTMTRNLYSALQEGTEPAGQVVFEFRASPNGVNVVNAVQDMEDVPLESRPAIYSQFALANRNRLIRALAGAEKTLERLKNQLLAEFRKLDATLSAQPVGEENDGDDEDIGDAGDDGDQHQPVRRPTRSSKRSV